MRNRKIWAAGLFAGCLTLSARADDTPPPANAPGPAASPQIGRSIFVANEVDGQAGDAPAQHIAVNDDIVFQEDITTGGDAKAVIEFRDGSTFEVGPDAAVRIDSFVFNPEENTSHKALSVTRGVFRYVSGYVASDQQATIAMPHGQMGIRGSLAEGVVDPDVPDFVFLGEGSATFSNSAGSVDLQPGGSVAVPSAATPPMAPTTMPPAVAAQALQAIDKRLPPRTVLANRPAADDAWLKRAGAANLVPAAEQQRMVATAGPPLPAARGRSGIVGELGLLVEGNRVGLFAGQQRQRTPEQAAFLDRAAHENPTAASVLHRFTTDARAIHSANVTAGTTLVIRGVGHAGASAEVVRRVTAAAVRANPGAAALINRHAGESHAPEHGGPARPNTPAAEHRTEHAPDVHRPNDFERKQPGGNARTPLGPQERRGAPPHPAAPQKTPAKPPAKEPPPKKKGERDQDQR